MSKTLAIIDFDSLYYKCSKDTVEESIRKLDRSLEDLLKEVNADYFIGFNSYTPYFRHKIFPEYKAPRGKYKTKLKYIQVLKKYSESQYAITHMREVEADDLVAYWSGKDFYLGTPKYTTSSDHKQVITVEKDILISDIIGVNNITKVICSADKDVLKLDCDKVFDMHKWKFVEDKNLGFFEMDQLITGDTSDGITQTLKGKGPAFAKKFSEGKSLSQYRTEIFDLYIKEYGFTKGVYQFQLNYRCLHMLDCDEDFMREIGRLPTLPDIQKTSYHFNNNLIEVKVDF